MGAGMVVYRLMSLGSFSGLLMNKNKNGGIWVGKLKHSKDKIEGIKCSEKPIKAL
jgi:hypothetical protein